MPGAETWWCDAEGVVSRAHLWPSAAYQSHGLFGEAAGAANDIARQNPKFFIPSNDQALEELSPVFDLKTVTPITGVGMHRGTDCAFDHDWADRWQTDGRWR